MLLGKYWRKVNCKHIPAIDSNRQRVGDFLSRGERSREPVFFCARQEQEAVVVGRKAYNSLSTTGYPESPRSSVILDQCGAEKLRLDERDGRKMECTVLELKEIRLYGFLE